MLAFVRGLLAAALVLLLSVLRDCRRQALQARRSRRRGDQARSADQVRGRPVTKTAAALRREADAAFQRNDFRTGMQILGQIVVVAPDDSANWLRLAKSVLQIRPSNDRERTELLERAATAAYIAYQRSSGNAGEEADSLVVIARSYADRSLWRPALDALRISLDLREVAEVRQQYERMREELRLPAARLHGRLRTPLRRASASSSPRTWPAGASTSRRSSPSPARTSRR